MGGIDPTDGDCPRDGECPNESDHSMDGGYPGGKCVFSVQFFRPNILGSHRKSCTIKMVDHSLKILYSIRKNDNRIKSYLD